MSKHAAPAKIPKYEIIPPERIEKRIYLLRGQKVMLDSDLAELYGVATKILNKAVSRNRDRFPADFMFQITREDARNLRFQFGTSSLHDKSAQGVARVWGGRRTLPYAFTEQGVAMLSGILNSPRAILVNVAIMRAFVKLRRLLNTHADLARKLDALERKYDAQFRVVFDAIRELMTPPAPRPRRIGFRKNPAAQDAAPRALRLTKDRSR